MLLDQYTPDAICHSMGIGEFVDPSWASYSDCTIRVLLKPSFDPEVCITISILESATRLTTIVLKEMLWQQHYPCTLPRSREVIELGNATSESIIHAHLAAVRETEQPKAHVVICDGMGMNCAWTTPAGIERFSSHVVGSAVTSFVAQLIDQAWQASTNAAVRNGLARCGRYVGAQYLIEPELESKNAQHIYVGVLGTQDDVRDYFQQLDRRPDDA